MYLMLVLGGNASPSVTDIQDVLKAAGIASEDVDIQRLLTCLEGQVWKVPVIWYVTFRVRYINSYLCLPLQDLEALLTMGAKRLVNWAGSQPSKCGVGAWPVPPVYPSDARKKRRVLGGPSSSEESPVRCV